LLDDEFGDRISITTRWLRRDKINEIWNSDCCSELHPSGEASKIASRIGNPLLICADLRWSVTSLQRKSNTCCFAG
jgi:hypothetical protein